jgi:hypothetical protein
MPGKWVEVVEEGKWLDTAEPGIEPLRSSSSSSSSSFPIPLTAPLGRRGSTVSGHVHCESELCEMRENGKDGNVPLCARVHNVCRGVSAHRT